MAMIGTVLVFVVLVPPLLWLVRRLYRFMWGDTFGSRGMNIVDLPFFLFGVVALWLICVIALEMIH
jgi:hypothetical protein